MGIYAEAEFKALCGTEYKVQILDTKYNGSTWSFVCEAEGYIQTWDGFREDLWFSPINNSSVVIPIHLSPNTMAMNLLVDDLRNGTEDQYYVRIYDSGNLIWMGKVLIDLVQTEDLAIARFELNATDGLNRLENFRCDFIDSIPGDQVSLIELVRRCIDPCGFAQFYGVNEIYISCMATWKETSQTNSGGFLKNTRISKLELIDDPEKGTKKTCKQALIDVLGGFGMSIRFDRGRWFITQPSNFTTTNALAYNYKKNGTFIGVEEILVQTTVTGAPNYPIATVVNSYKPNYKEVAVRCIDRGDYRFEKSSFNKSSLEITLSTASKENDYDFKYFLQYAYLVAGSTGKNGKSVTFLTAFRMLCGDYQLRSVSGQFKWIRGPIREVAGVSNTSPVRLDDTVTVFGPEVLKADGSFKIPKLPSDSPSSISITIWVSANDQSRPWMGLFKIKQNGPSEIQYSTSNNDVNAASVSLSKEVSVSDFANDFSSSPIQIYTGSEWKYSQAWTADGSSEGGVPVLQLLTQQAMYFQRNPRLLIQGQFNITDADSLKKIVWRSGAYLFLNGTYTAATNVWDGVWMELLSQTTNTVTVSNNPYRDLIDKINLDLSKLTIDLANTNNRLGTISGIVTKNQQQIFQLTNRSQMGAEDDLLQNVPGIPIAAGDDTSYKLIAIVAADGSKKVNLQFTPDV
jgi:hypothetical protein